MPTSGRSSTGSHAPILANVYLHYVLDLWFQKKWRARKATGDTIIVRYCDDFVVGCQRKADADQFLHDLGKRLSQFALELHPEPERQRRALLAQRQALARWSDDSTLGGERAGGGGEALPAGPGLP